MFVFKTDIPMREEEFHLLRDFVYQYCGLHFDLDSKYLLEKRLNKRLTQHRLSSFRDYYYLLRYSRDKDQELAAVIDLLTTNETYFFREDFQLKTFTDEIIPEVCEEKRQRGERSLRIWSAGCSSGEEPYTIAMLLMERPELVAWNINVIGTDISQDVLSKARHGVYGSNSFRATDDYFLSKYFNPCPEEEKKWKIDDRVKQRVSISHLNLFDSRRVSLLGQVDLIFCRNVIIYFDLESKRMVISNLHDRLVSGGFLLLGHSESLMNISTDFQLRHFVNDMVYQRPIASTGGICG
ncbi:MAG TPA: protein-glutamate O-methyltransferase CheR [Geopsychrobacteraceae bacterium]|nr:protein-glutamate O-methyltransferase CheR [Geopsychrobacteraceae bacterium]